MNIGILGLGKIAHNMAKTIIGMKDSDITLYAVGSSDLEKSRDFAQKYNVSKYYGSYEELAKDENVDLIYIATIHTMHYGHAMLCLEKGKNVLVEKPFAVNSRQAKEMFNKAKEKNLFISEAIWTRFMPACQYLKKVKQDKIIGEVSSVNADIGYNLSDVERMTNLDLGGGALLDIGIYPIHFAMMVLGDDVQSADGFCTKLPTGPDGVDSITLKWKDAIASVHANMLCNTDKNGFIYGTEGYIKADDVNNPKIIQVYDKNRNLVKTEDFSNQITGFEYQVKACCDAVKKGEKESVYAPHSLTLKVMEIMDGLREKWNVVYPCD